MKSLNVAVLKGGWSTEREVSMRSGAAVAKALAAAGMKVKQVDIRGADFELPAKSDVAFIAMHGTFGEDGRLQRILEDCGIPYTGSSPEASALAFDKAASKQKFVAAKIPTPPYEVLDTTLTALAEIKPPVVVKPARQGSSVGVTIVLKRDQLDQAYKEARRFDEKVLVEKFIKGRELTVGIFDGKALPVIEVKPKKGFFNYEAKYTEGQTDYFVPAKLDAVLSSSARYLAKKAHDVLGCRDFSRVDLMLGDGGDLHVLEVNTIPGFTATSLVPKAARAAGIGFEAMCVRLVELALARRKTARAVEREENCPAAQFFRSLNAATISA